MVSKKLECHDDGCVVVEKATKKYASWYLLLPLLGVMSAVGLRYVADIKAEVAQNKAELKADMVDADKEIKDAIKNVNLKLDAILVYQSSMDKALAEHKAITEGRK